MSVKPLLGDPVFPDHILLNGDRPSLMDLENFAAAESVLYVANVGRHDAEELS